MAILMRVSLMLIGMWVAPAYAQQLHLAEQSIKSGLIYNFLKHTQWPQGGDAITVCLAGGNNLGKAVLRMEGRTVNRREIHIRKVKAGEEIADCNLLYVSGNVEWNALKKQVAGRPVLTVSDTKMFVRDGGMIALYHEEQRIRADLNRKTLRAAGLDVQDRMLQLVNTVNGE